MSESLMFYGARRAFARHYIPTFMVGMFSVGASSGCKLLIVLTTYFHGVSLDEVGSPIAIAYLLLMILIVVSNYLIARGRPRWIWVMIILSTLGFFIVLPALAFEPDRLIYALGICSPLLCLLILNTPVTGSFARNVWNSGTGERLMSVN